MTLLVVFFLVLTLVSMLVGIVWAGGHGCRVGLHDWWCGRCEHCDVRKF